MSTRILKTAYALVLFSVTLASASAIAQNGDTMRKVPPRGTDMMAVERTMGPPESMIPPVGEPPITRWIYSDVTVYFEYDRMLHVVSNSVSSAAK